MMSLYAAVAVIILCYFSILFALACVYSNYAIADIGWGLGFVLTALYCAFSTPDHSRLEWVTTGLVFIWGCRLSVYIYLRNKGKPEDFRYRQLREKWNRLTNLHAFFKLFMTQAVIMIVVSVAIVTAANSSIDHLSWISWLFCALALFGFTYESISDYQLARFKKGTENRGKIMTQGLWRYSRHPNYFGEIVFWWGISLLVAFSTGQYYALISGLTMNLLIVFVSGVPMLEDKYKDNPSYVNYIRLTNSILPGRSKKT